MPLDPKIEKRINKLFHNTRCMPFLAIIGIFFPIILIISGPLGLVYWFWRRNILRAADSGKLVFDPIPPPLPTSDLSPEPTLAAKLDFIRSDTQALLIPLYVLLGLALLLACYMAI